jgi:N-acetylglucosaminyl-diphospho-decaprenol L-rhamnosyltransferase
MSSASALRPAIEPTPRILPVPVEQPIDVSILIVTWNSESWISRCLAALPAACRSLHYEVIVYDNASADRSHQAAEASSIERLQVIAGAENRGFAAGMNQALEKARGQYVFFLNPDCELRPDSIQTLVEYLDRNAPVAAVAPLLIGEDGRPQREFQLRRFPTLNSFATDLLMVDELFPGNPASSRYRYRDLDITSPQPVDQPAAAALLVRRAACDDIGFFDERFFPAWFEDVDFCQRLWRAGYAIHVNPRAVATHHGGASLVHVRFEQFLSAWYRNLHHYAEKWFTPAQTEMLRWLVIAGMLLRIGAFCIGLSKAPVSRWVAIQAHLAVLKEAFDRWDASPSS